MNSNLPEIPAGFEILEERDGVTVIGDMSQASAGLYYFCGDVGEPEDGWTNTPFQTADGQHDAAACAELVFGWNK